MLASCPPQNNWAQNRTTSQRHRKTTAPTPRSGRDHSARTTTSLILSNSRLSLRIRQLTNGLIIYIRSRLKKHRLSSTNKRRLTTKTIRTRLITRNHTFRTLNLLTTSHRSRIIIILTVNLTQNRISNLLLTRNRINRNMIGTKSRLIYTTNRIRHLTAIVTTIGLNTIIRHTTMISLSLLTSIKRTSLSFRSSNNRTQTGQRGAAIRTWRPEQSGHPIKCDYRIGQAGMITAGNLPYPHPEGPSESSTSYYSPSPYYSAS